MAERGASVHGDVGLLTTHIPPKQMDSVSFNQGAFGVSAARQAFQVALQ